MKKIMIMLGFLVLGVSLFGQTPSMGFPQKIEIKELNLTLDYQREVHTSMMDDWGGRTSTDLQIFHYQTTSHDGWLDITTPTSQAVFQSLSMQRIFSFSSLKPAVINFCHDKRIIVSSGRRYLILDRRENFVMDLVLPEAIKDYDPFCTLTWTWK